MTRKKDASPYAKVSIDLLDNRKVMELSPPAFRLYVLGIVASARDLSDGLIKIGRTLSEVSAQPRHRRELVAAELWHEFGHTCQSCPQPPPPLGREEHAIIHDYLAYQQSRSDVQKRQQVKAKAGRKGAAARWGKDMAGATPDEIADANASANGRTAGRAIADVWPEPEPEVLPAQSPLRVVPFPQPPDF